MFVGIGDRIGGFMGCHIVMYGEQIINYILDEEYSSLAIWTKGVDFNDNF